MNDTRLFISGKEVEFSQDPKILFNYKGTELSNPTIVKNSFTKTVNIEGTPQNNDIFGSIFDLQRIQDSSLYNPTQKAPFELYINSELIEKGYAKLDSITTANHKVTYNVTLYGGLGGFFYNLSYAPDSNEKKTLASLQYITDEIKTDPDLDFVINKETVIDAWSCLMRTQAEKEKWRCINFAPCYNGIPSDFSADKALINNNELYSGVFEKSASKDNVLYRPLYHGSRNESGFSYAQFSEPMTCDETFDLRSYLQRPVVSVHRTLQAIFQPENNGGYQVKLDPHFFHWDNPYWNQDAWVTLPMLRSLEVGQGASETVTGATFSDYDYRLKQVDFDTPSLSKISNVKMKVNIKWNPNETQTQTRLYDNRTLNINTNAHIFNGNTYVKKLINSEGICMQLWALDMNGNIVAASDAYLLGGSRNIANTDTPLWDGFYSERETPDIRPDEYKWVRGQWLKSGNGYDFCDDAGNAIGLSFSLNANVEYTSLVMKIKLPSSYYIKYAWRGTDDFYDDNLYNPLPYQFPLWTKNVDNLSGDYTRLQAVDVERIWGTLSYDIVEFEAVATDYDTFFSNTPITKQKLLATPYTPAEFLLSYAKMFGLYFYRDPAETADDPVACPNGVIHIMDRDTFFTDEYEDIEKLIDRGKDMVITPALASTKWYEFKQEPLESAAEKDYEDTYGYTYGRQLVNTNYDFDSNTTQLYDGSVFKSGLMVREKDKYFSVPFGGVRSSVFNGCTYSLFAPTNDGYDAYDIDIPVSKRYDYAINDLDLPYYDLMPKLQCHGRDNDPIDGDGVLLFYNGIQQCLGERVGEGSESRYVVPYWITDDTVDMMTLNGGQPCWLMGNSEYAGGPNGDRVAVKTLMLPRFTRDMLSYGWEEGNVAHSWNFGKPMVTFVPNVYNSDSDNIYNSYWKDYCHDLFSDDGKKLTCYVHFKNRPHPYALRKWYWFDNSIWRLNEIKDWNVADNAAVQCEFIKVQDVENYKLGETHQGGGTEITVSPTIIGGSGGVVTYTVVMEDCGPWYIRGEAISGMDEQENRYYIYPETTAGTGCLTTFNVTVPPTSASTPITWTAKFRNSYDENIGEPTFVQTTGATPSGTSYINLLYGAELPAVPSAPWYILEFTYGNIDWNTITAICDSDWWVYLGKFNLQHKSIQYTVSANTGSQRTGTVYLVGQDINNGNIVSSNTVSIVQAGGSSSGSGTTVYFEFYNDEMEATAAGGYYSAYFHCVGMDNSTISASTNVNFCTVEYIFPNDNPPTIQFSITANEGSDYRLAIIELAGKDTNGTVHKTYLNVLQGATGILVYPDREIILDYDAGDSEERQVTTNNNWTITINDL